VHDFFQWAIACARIFFLMLKIKIMILESTYSIFSPMAPIARFFFQQFFCAGMVFLEIAHPHPPEKK
jgi:hypothetical protein